MRLAAGILAGAILALASSGANALVCHVGVGTGGSIASTAVNSTTSSFGVDGLGGRSTRPDLQLGGGCDIVLTGSPLVFGLWGDWTSQDVKFSVNPALFSAALGDSFAGGGRVGLQFGNAMPYILVGFAHTDINWSHTFTGVPTSDSGIVYGGGIEAGIPKTNFSVAAEARWYRYNSESLSASSHADIKPDQLQAMVHLNYAFTSLFSSDAGRAAPLK